MNWTPLAFPLLALAVAFVLFPYLRRRERADVSHLESDVAFDPLLERKQIILRNILDLEFEHRMGKLSDADYAAARQEMEQEAAEILDRLEAGADTPPAPVGPLAEGAVACPKCGAESPAGNRFCGTCGAPLEKVS